MTSSGAGSDPRPGLTRPYVLTGGRTRSLDDLALEAIVVTERTTLPMGAAPELIAIVDLCRSPHSIAAISTIARSSGAAPIASESRSVTTIASSGRSAALRVRPPVST